jgi:uncharacterized protein (TIGR02001 family)
MKKTMSSTLVAALLAGSAGLAQADLTANLGLSSDYMWRGISQTQRDPAISGGLDYSDESGLFVGTWVSNTTDANDDDGYEVDLYAGYAGEAGDLGYTATIIHYAYPDYDDLDFTEVMLDLSYSFISGGVAYTVDCDADCEDNVYYHIGPTFELNENWTFQATAGYFDFYDGTSYSHTQLDLTRSMGSGGDLTFSLSKAETEDAGLVSEATYFLFGWTKTFDL